VADASLLIAAPPAADIPRGWRRWLLVNLGVFALYSIAGLVVFVVGIGATDTSPIYPAAGIAVAAALIFGPSVWPAIWLGNFCNGAPLFWASDTSFIAALIGNGCGGIEAMVEALTAAGLMRQLTGTWHPFDRATDAVIFLAVASLVSAPLGAAIGVTAFWLTSVTPTDQWPITFVTWWLADAAGIAVFGPLVLAWYRERPLVDRPLIVTIAAVVAAVLVIATLGHLSGYPIDYLFLPVLLWAGFREKARGVTFAAAAISAVIIVATAAGVGSFVGKTGNQSFLLVEGFVAVITFTGLLMIAVRAQQSAAESALEAHNRMLEQRVAERTAEVAEKNRLLEEKQQRLDEDLIVARQLQAAILPTDFDSFTATSIAAIIRPAYEMAGDFYDTFRIGENRLGLVVGDVSGKGIAASFFMAVARTVMRDIASSGASPSDCVTRLNQTLCAENPLDMFVTLFYAELNEATSEVIYVNAGHCEPVMVSAAAGARLLARTGNPALGIVADKSFSEHRVILAPGETLFLYTDGVTEAFSPEGKLFAVERLLQVAAAEAGSAPRDLVVAVVRSVDAFADGAVQSDDITCLAVRRRDA
jgi:serine phosphatase RsbU (regulator of sigma subunit)